MSIFKPVLGKVYQFKGCVWNAHWEFDCPAVIYSPVCVYRDNCGSIDEQTIKDMIEDVCVDICWSALKPVYTKFSILDWRGRSVKGFARRRNAIHCVVPVRFKLGDNNEGMSFDIGDEIAEYVRY